MPKTMNDIVLRAGYLVNPLLALFYLVTASLCCAS
jgi:hypothetical protein